MHRRTFLAASTLGLVAALARFDFSSAAPLTVASGHPRLMLRNFDHIRQVVAGDDVAAGWYAKIKAAADAVLDLDPVTYVIPDGLRLLATSREALHRVYSLSFAYAVEDDIRYRDRLWTELAAVCAFPDWNSQRHFLDVAEMTHAVAIGYDWWFNEWTTEQRATLETAIVSYGLEPAIAVYNGGPTAHKWPTWTNNWNIVCNSGMLAGALAVADVGGSVSDTATTVVEKAFATLPLAIAEYAPDGGYPEGAGYWEYAAKYLALGLASLDTALGGDSGRGDRGLSDSPGVSTTVDFPLHLAGPTGQTFNYYDGASGASRIPEMFWFAQRFDRPDYAWLGELGATTRQPGWAQLPIGLIWYDPSDTSGPVASATSLDAYFAHCAVATARSGWERDEAVFLAGKAGNNATSHADLDIGSWVLDALGQRWFVELGSDNYNLPGYFHEERWTYYRKRPEGQNTLVAGPGSDPGQRVDGTGTVVARASGPDEAWFVIDGTGAHPGITSWRRGWRLFSYRRRVVVQDEITTTTAKDLWWFAHTAAAISVAEDGRSATLEQSGQRLLARLVSPADASLLEMAPEPLWTSPDPAGQATNDGLRKLAVWLPEVTTARIVVEFTPLTGATTPEVAPIVPLADWADPATEVATINSLKIGGTAVPGFSPANFGYGVADLSGTVTATAPAGTTVRVLPGRHGQPTQVIAIKGGARRGVYWLWQQVPLGLGNFPSSIIASTDDGNVPTNTMDGDLSTRWSAEGDGQWIAYDMGSDGAVDSVRIAWNSGTTRTSRFDVEVALDGATTWTPVFSGSSSGTTNDLETHSFPATRARYLRIVGHGNSANGWNSITELEIPGRTVEVKVVNRLEALDLAAGPVPVGGTATATLIGRMTNGEVASLDGVAISWVSLSPELATVSDTGQITGVTTGKAVIAAIGRTADHRLLHTRVEVGVADPNRPRFVSVADTYVRDGTYATKMFGKDAKVLVKFVPDPDTGFTRRGFLQFSPEAQQRAIDKVLLHFYGKVADNNGTVTELVFRRGGAPVDEAATTWANQPPLGDELGRLTLDSTLAWHEVDLTTGLAAAVAAGESIVVGVVQQPATGQGLATEVHSRQSANIPYLEVVLAPQ